MNRDNPYKKTNNTSIDGFFIPRGSTYRRSSPRPPLRKSAGNAPGSIRSLNSFAKNVDGFKSSSQSVISSDGFKHRSADISLPMMSRPRISKEESTDSDRSAPSKRRYVDKDIKDKKQSRKRSALPALRRSNRRQRTRKQKLMLRTAGVMGSLIILLGAGIAIRALILGNSIFKGGGSSAVLNSQDIDPSLLRGEGDGRVNIIVLGKGGAEQLDGPDLTDTIIVASIDPIAKEAALLSVPRDFWVKSPSGGQSKINQVYYDAKHKALNAFSGNQRESDDAKARSETAGIDAIKQTVGDVMGVPVHYHIMVDFAGFKKAIDTVGGIDINVTDDMAVRERLWIDGHYDLDVGTGHQHFDGMRALAFSRSRKTSARGDYARSDRQRAVMIGLKDKVLSSGTLTNPIRINQLMSDFSGQLGTDFSVNEMLRLYDLAKEIPSDKIESISLEEHVGGDMVNGLSVQVPKLGLFEYSDLQGFVRNKLRDSFLKKEDAKIMILNGTEIPGLATQKGNELKSYGYSVTAIGDAPTKGLQNTVLVDLRNGANRYTKSYLEKRLGVSSSNVLPDNSISTEDSDFVIILGINEANR